MMSVWWSLGIELKNTGGSEPSNWGLLRLTLRGPQDPDHGNPVHLLEGELRLEDRKVAVVDPGEEHGAGGAVRDGAQLQDEQSVGVLAEGLEPGDHSAPGHPHHQRYRKDDKLLKPNDSIGTYIPISWTQRCHSAARSCRCSWDKPPPVCRRAEASAPPLCVCSPCSSCTPASSAPPTAACSSSARTPQSSDQSGSAGCTPPETTSGAESSAGPRTGETECPPASSRSPQCSRSSDSAPPTKPPSPEPPAPESRPRPPPPPASNQVPNHASHPSPVATRRTSLDSPAASRSLAPQEPAQQVPVLRLAVLAPPQLLQLENRAPDGPPHVLRHLEPGGQVRLPLALQVLNQAPRVLAVLHRVVVDRHDVRVARGELGNHAPGRIGLRGYPEEVPQRHVQVAEKVHDPLVVVPRHQAVLLHHGGVVAGILVWQPLNVLLQVRDLHLALIGEVQIYDRKVPLVHAVQDPRHVLLPLELLPAGGKPRQHVTPVHVTVLTEPGPSQPAAPLSGSSPSRSPNPSVILIQVVALFEIQGVNELLNHQVGEKHRVAGRSGPRRALYLKKGSRQRYRQTGSVYYGELLPEDLGVPDQGLVVKVVIIHDERDRTRSIAQLEHQNPLEIGALRRVGEAASWPLADPPPDVLIVPVVGQREPAEVSQPQARTPLRVQNASKQDAIGQINEVRVRCLSKVERSVDPRPVLQDNEVGPPLVGVAAPQPAELLQTSKGLPVEAALDERRDLRVHAKVIDQQVTHRRGVRDEVGVARLVCQSGPELEAHHLLLELRSPERQLHKTECLTACRLQSQGLPGEAAHLPDQPGLLVEPSLAIYLRQPSEDVHRGAQGLPGEHAARVPLADQGVALQVHEGCQLPVPQLLQTLRHQRLLAAALVLVYNRVGQDRLNDGFIRDVPIVAPKESTRETVGGPQKVLRRVKLGPPELVVPIVIKHGEKDGLQPPHHLQTVPQAADGAVLLVDVSLPGPPPGAPAATSRARAGAVGAAAAPLGSRAALQERLEGSPPADLLHLRLELRDLGEDRPVGARVPPNPVVVLRQKGVPLVHPDNVLGEQSVDHAHQHIHVLVDSLTGPV
ncbi:hypothetical protein OJ252_471 [Cryptosporidium canis]|uniref:Uncharacterized protein n=1 Tax=Cryptosporidium canis TaxID=195482 RepID=A0ABQ8PDN3_9CRYT|nr:hypothetical protein OJ252_471 [Cryptosporidium canis]